MVLPAFICRTISTTLLILTASLKSETLQPLASGQAAPANFEEMWAGYDPKKEPLDTEVLKEWEEDGVTLRVLRYRAGVFKGQKSMIAGIFGFPKGRSKLPGLVQIHGGGQYADHKAVLTNAKRGYATISIAWAGRISAPGYRVNPDDVKLFWEGKTDHKDYLITTDWGALDGYHAPSRNKGNSFLNARPHPWTLDTIESPRNCPWFLCTLAARRAITFLEQQPEVDASKLGVYGHSMGGKLSVMTAAADDRIKAAAPSCGGISDRESDSTLFLETTGDAVQHPHITCPTIFLSPSNDFHGRIGDLKKSAGALSTDQWRFTCSPHHNHQDTASYEVASQLWFDEHLKGVFKMPETPRSEITLRKIPQISVTPDSSKEILSVDFYYTQQGKKNETRRDHENTKHRFWHHVRGKLVNGKATAELPLFTTDAPLWAYANVSYKLDEPITGAGYYYGIYEAKDFNLSSFLHQVSPKKLKESGAEVTLKHSYLIERFDQDWEKEWFNLKPDDGWSVTTNKLYAPEWQAPVGGLLVLKVRSEKRNQLVVRIDNFLAEHSLKGDGTWETVVLREADFESPSEGTLDFSLAMQLELSPRETIRSKDRKVTVTKGGTWKGAKPEFRNLRWITPTDPRALMPKPQDQTQLWWTDGFPKNNPGAPWERQIETGNYRLVYNTETLAISELGPEKRPAKLELKITKAGKVYRAVAGGKWTKYTGPRLIESGQVFQRIDVTNLMFKSAEGETLDPKARLEIAAWPDRLAFIFSTEDHSQLEMILSQGNKTLRQTGNGKEIFLGFDPTTFQKERSPIHVSAGMLPVAYHPSLGWHRINLDRHQTIGEGNDVMEKASFTLQNPTSQEQIARLMFEKTAGGFRGRTGSAITGVSAMIRDADGNPTGIPVQLSKNWHSKKEAGTYNGQWFHGITQIRLPARAVVKLEFVLVNGHWGGLPAASHAQLSLIGWGGNSLWEQSALGSWGESICYDPDQALAHTTITDVRPMMVRGMSGKDRWGWTANMGGGDFFRFFHPNGKRAPHAAMRTTYHKYGPCLTEVSYAGKIANAIDHQMTVSLGRTDDLVRGTYLIRMKAKKAVDFSRFVIFQVGSDTYNFTTEKKMAAGNSKRLLKEWSTQWGGDSYRNTPIKLKGSAPWVSLHEGVSSEKANGGAIANRGVIIREWKARLGGKEAAPFIAERGVTRHRRDSSTIDILPPPGITRLQKGDFIEATIEHLIIPQSASDYYGPNEALRNALKQDGNTWRMVHREATGNHREISMQSGDLIRTFPDVRIHSAGAPVEFTLSQGLGYIPLTITGLPSYRGGSLFLNGNKIDQSTHGNDYWQSNFDPLTKTWSQTFNLPIESSGKNIIRFLPIS